MSPSLKRSSAGSATRAAHRPDPALRRQHDRDRLAFDERLRGDRHGGGGTGDHRTPVAQRPAAEFFPRLLELTGDSFPPQLRVFQQGEQVLAFPRKALVLLADLHFLQLTQRTQPHVEDRLGLHVGERKPRHQPRLRLVLLADDADDLVEVEVDRKVAVEHLDPAFDRGEAMARAAFQHLVAVIEPGSQHFDEAHHTRRPRGVEHVHIEAENGSPARWRGTAFPSALPVRRRGCAARTAGARSRCSRRARRRAAAASSPRSAPRSARSAAPSAPDREFQ